MSDISELEGRISAAMERIGRGLETLQHSAVPVDVGDGQSDGHDDGQLEAVRRELEEERQAAVEIGERVRALTDRQSELEAELVNALEAKTSAEAALETARQADAVQEKSQSEETLQAQGEAMKEMGKRMRRLKQLNRTIRQSNAKLRADLEGAVVNPDHINESLRLEVEAAKAEHKLDIAASSVILKGLEPMLVGMGSQEETEDAAEETGDA